MESKVEMTLEEYTTLIRENERLKAILQKCRGELREDAVGSIRCYAIGSLPKEKCLAAMQSDDKELIKEFAYSGAVGSLFLKFPCFSEGEIEAVLAENIRRKVQERIEELDESDN